MKLSKLEDGHSSILLPIYSSESVILVFTCVIANEIIITIFHLLIYESIRQNNYK